MTSTRSQLSYLSPSEPSLQPPKPKPLTGSKLRKSERDKGGNVLPNGSGTGYGQTNANGTVVTGTQVGASASLAPRIHATLAQAKERRQARQHGDALWRRNLTVDEEGVAHDSEYVKFRAATPVYMHKKMENMTAMPNDDGSASSSSSEDEDSSAASGMPSSPYTYQSTQRTTPAKHHYVAPLGATASAVPPYLQSKTVRSSFDYPTSLSVPRAPDPRRASDEYERPYSLSSTTFGSRSRPAPQFTTSSYQPPAPVFSARPGDFNGPLRLPTGMRAPSSTGSGSLSESMSKMDLDVERTGSGSGYNSFSSVRPTKTDGSVFEAGMHGLGRSWDGFKLDMKFGARSVSKKIERKMKRLT